MAEGKFKIRIAEKADSLFISTIETATSAMPWSEQAIAREIEENDRAIVLVTEYFDLTVGFSLPQIVAYADAWKVADELQLNNIAVLKSYRGNGLATELLEVLAESGRELGCKTINLEVRESNTPARRLYGKCGFVEVGKREGYYEDNGETAVLMDKVL